MRRKIIRIIRKEEGSRRRRRRKRRKRRRKSTVGHPGDEDESEMKGLRRRGDNKTKNTRGE